MMSRRVALIARLKPDRIDDYLAMHRDPEPAIRAAMAAAHHVDYRLFRWGEIIVATFLYEGSDLEADRARLRAAPELTDWMTQTAACQEQIEGAAGRPIWTTMEEIYAGD